MYVPAPRYCSTDFDGASSPHLRTRLTDKIASLLYVERNEEICIYKGISIRDQVFVL